MMRFSLVAGVIWAALPLTAWAACMGPYPPSMVRAFNQNCARDAKLQAYCSCVMDGVQKTIPLADFIEIGNSPGGINGDPRFIKASDSCSPKIPAGTPMGGSAPSIPGGQSASANEK
jgi:hypothetical protein